MLQGPIDSVRQQWKRELPDLDTSSLAVFGRIDRVAKTVRTQGKAALAELGVRPWEYEILATLRRSAPANELAPRELSAELVVSTGAMTNRLDHLERSGDIERSADPDDRRALRIRLTEKGRQRAERAVETYLRRERELLGALDAWERQSLERLLRKLVAATDQLA
jgi:DNA-binding MarR family transcriptional regulator